MGLLSVLRGGIPVVFMAGPREIAELLTYDQKNFVREGNRIEKKVRLYVSFAEKFRERQTGYWFDPVTDFDPPLPDPRSDGRIPWEDLGATVIFCFKSFQGNFKWKEQRINALELRIKSINEELLSLKKDSIELIRMIEKVKDPEVRKEEVFENAEALSVINRIVHKIPEGTDDDLLLKKMRTQSGLDFIKQ